MSATTVTDRQALRLPLRRCATARRSDRSAIADMRERPFPKVIPERPSLTRHCERRGHDCASVAEDRRTALASGCSGSRMSLRHKAFSAAFKAIALIGADRWGRGFAQGAGVILTLH